MDIGQAALLFAAGFGGGIAAAIAGGASLVTFPTLLGHRAAAGRRQCHQRGRAVAEQFHGGGGGLAATAELGPLVELAVRRSTCSAARVGALLMLETPADLLILLVPALIGGATLLFAIGPWMQRRLPSDGRGPLAVARVAFPLFLSAIYGGYFGAALGVINLAILAIGGLTDFRSTNVLKNLLITGVSASSVWIYVWQGAVVWPAMVVLMAGSIGGGYAGGHLIRILPPRLVRIAIIAFGTAATALYASKYWF